MAADSTTTPTRPNVLFIIADDLNADLGAYGERLVTTPHIDQLAAHSVTFDRAYCQFPLCGPSRASLLTGRMPDITRVLANPRGNQPDGGFRTAIPDTVTLPQFFRQHGWTTARIGKLFHQAVPNGIGKAGQDDSISWDLTINPRGRDREIHPQIHTLVPDRYGGVLSWLADENHPDDAYTDGIAATEAIGLLRSYRDAPAPFFLAVGFYRPHTPFVAPQRYFDLVPREEIPLPVLSPSDQLRQPAPAYASLHPEEASLDDDRRREIIQAYRASIGFMDAQVGGASLRLSTFEDSA